MAERRKFDDMHPTFPKESRIICKDCLYRDKTEVEFMGRTYKTGTTKTNCEQMERKPVGILFNGDPCPFYERE